MDTPRRLVASFTGSGAFGATPLLRALEALEKRGVEYHKSLPATVEVATAREVADAEDPTGGFTTRTVQVGWGPFHEEPKLSTRGLDGLREKLPELPGGLAGIRVSLAYAFPGREAEAVALTALIRGGARYELRLTADAARALDATNRKLSRANVLMVADLAEALYDTLDPAYGAVRLDAGVLPDALPTGGWLFACGALVERAGRAAVEAYAAGCYKSWELADGGWFLAPRPLDEPDREAAAARAALFAPCRHLPLEAMREAAWKAS